MQQLDIKRDQKSWNNRENKLIYQTGREQHNDKRIRQKCSYRFAQKHSAKEFFVFLRWSHMVDLQEKNGYAREKKSDQTYRKCCIRMKHETISKQDDSNRFSKRRQSSRISRIFSNVFFARYVALDVEPENVLEGVIQAKQ